MVTHVDVDVPQLWRDYRAEPTVEMRNQLVEIYLPLVGMLDIAKELERLGKELAQAQQEVVRLQGKLANQSFVTRAKPEVVEKEREKLITQEERVEKLKAQRAELGG